jgi:hypothetical protein
MTNRILDVLVLNHRLDPVETELRVYIKLAEITPTTQIRGRLTGPRCLYTSTIEIAYPLREIARTDHIELRVVIPEPSWWDPESPFLYDGTIELSQDGESCGRAELRHGIRWLQITSKGLRLNGHSYTLRGRFIEKWSDDLAPKLRADGINMVVTTAIGLECWDAADRFGFFVIGSSEDQAQFLQYRNHVSSCASAFGWIFNRAEFHIGPVQDDVRAMFYGINTSVRSMPANADFLFCYEHELSWLDDAGLPKIVLTKRLSDPLPARADVLGWIETL